MINKNITGNKIENVIFDFGGVLLDLYMDKTYDELSSLLGIEMNHDAVSEKTMKFLYDFEKGQIRFETWLWNMQRLSKTNIPLPRHVINAWNKMLGGWQQEKLDILSKLKTIIPVYLLSNTNEIHLEWVYKDLSTNHGIEDFESRFFIKAYYSHLINFRKPDDNIFEFVLEDSKLNPSNTLFIDDNLENINTANKLGFQTVHHECNAPIDYIFDIIK